jgi:hypothetical protein
MCAVKEKYPPTAILRTCPRKAIDEFPPLTFERRSSTWIVYTPLITGVLIDFSWKAGLGKILLYRCPLKVIVDRQPG